jgi:hypothetical protein
MTEKDLKTTCRYYVDGVVRSHSILGDSFDSHAFAMRVEDSLKKKSPDPSELPIPKTLGIINKDSEEEKREDVRKLIGEYVDQKLNSFPLIPTDQCPGCESGCDNSSAHTDVCNAKADGEFWRICGWEFKTMHN